MTEDFTSWFLDGEVHIDETLSRREVHSIVVVGSTFTRCDLRNLVARDANFGVKARSLYDSCVFDNSKLIMGPGSRATFVNCSFRDVRISRWEALYTSLIDCTFTGSLRGCTFFAQVPEEYPPGIERGVNEIRGNDFSGCRMTQVYFDAGVDLSQQRLPSGPDYVLLPDAPAALAALRAEMNDWVPADRDIGEAFLRLFDRHIRRGQTQIFGRRNEYTRFHEVAGRVVDFWKANHLTA